MTIRSLLAYLHAQVRNYNLFIPDEDDYDDGDDTSTNTTNFVERQVYSTWIYIFFLTSKCPVVSFYYSLVHSIFSDPQRS